MLQEYLTATRDLLRDSNGQFYSTSQLTRFINKGRSQTAQMTTCIRVLVAGGSAYGTDSTAGYATAGAMIPGAVGTPSGLSVFNTIPGVERYRFDYANPIVRQQNAGVKGIIDVMSVSVNWGGAFRPTLDWCPWEELQAYCRAWNVSLQTYPSVFSTNATGAGENGEVWLFPQPGTAVEMEWLTACVPLPLYTDSDPEALPAPYRGAVPYYAAKLAYENSQRWGAAQQMESDFESHLLIASAAGDRGKIRTMYPDYS